MSCKGQIDRFYIYKTDTILNDLSSYSEISQEQLKVLVLISFVLQLERNSVRYAVKEQHVILTARKHIKPPPIGLYQLPELPKDKSNPITAELVFIIKSLIINHLSILRCRSMFSPRSLFCCTLTSFLGTLWNLLGKETLRQTHKIECSSSSKMNNIYLARHFFPLHQSAD